jgi:pyochelin biosynthesis protein PchC
VTEQPGTWIRRFHPAPDGAVRLACFPHAGGSATFYFPLSRALSPSLEVAAVQYPGRQDRRAEACVDSIEELADLITRELLPLTDRPMALFGHSMGALLGYEVARRLQRSGRAPLGLFASAREAPSARCAELVHLRDDAGIVAALAGLNGTQTAVLAEDELLRAILPAVRADYKAVETYCHRGEDVLTCPIYVLTGEDDSMTTAAGVRPWAGYTSARCEFETFSGGHFYVNGQLQRLSQTVLRQTGDWVRAGGCALPEGRLS